MGCQGSEPIEVLRRTVDPVHFIWRGRLFMVRDVLAHWVEVGEWWRAALTHVLASRGQSSPFGAVAEGARTTGADTRRIATSVALMPAPRSDWVVTEQTDVTIVHCAEGQSGEVVSGRLGNGGGPHDDIDQRALARSRRPMVPRQLSRSTDIDRELWRVRASAGRSSAPGDFDLCLDLASGQWTLEVVGPHDQREAGAEEGSR